MSPRGEAADEPTNENQIGVQARGKTTTQYMVEDC